MKCSAIGDGQDDDMGAHSLAERLEAYRQQLHDTVVEKDARLKDLGSRDYLGQMT